MTRGLVSVSGANTPHPFLVFSILKRLKSLKIFNFIKSSQNEGLDTNFSENFISRSFNALAVAGASQFLSPWSILGLLKGLVHFSLLWTTQARYFHDVSSIF